MWYGRILQRLEQKVDNLMSTFADLQAALNAVVVDVAEVKSDVDSLLAKLAAIPAAGLTADQQAVLDASVTQAQGIATSLAAINAEVNPPAATVTTATPAAKP
jgi:septal ring factor EnvC (AmiA/AmiB activator)